MKRPALLALAVLALLAAGAVVWRGVDGAGAGARENGWLARGAALLGFGGGAPAGWSGYVEADYLLVGSTLGGTVTALAVARGDRVAAGDVLFRLDDTAERAARDEARARLAQAEATLANLLTGRRPAEIAAIRAQREQARAALRNSEAEYERQVQLRRARVSAERQLDDARAARDRDRARLAEIEAQLRVAALPGREAEIGAAEAAVAAARAALGQAEWRLAQKTGTAPAAAVVVDTLYRPGEVVPPGLPVVQLLPPANLHVRFFVPETALAGLEVGQAVRVACDGCGAPVAARVRYIAPRAEFTPPVIYSREQRDRLVFMVEAVPAEGGAPLHVGLPVDVTLAERAP